MLEAFLDKIRTSNHQRKKLWVVGMSAATMIIVVVLWFYYLNTIIKPAQELTSERGGQGFWFTMKKGSAIVLESLTNQVNTLMQELMQERAITIEK